MTRCGNRREEDKGITRSCGMSNATQWPEAQIERSACPTCGSCSGMFTANSMNCLTEALGLSLPGNGSMLATHAERKQLFLRAGRLIVDLAKRYYEQDDASILLRSIASFEAFENAIRTNAAIGGSTELSIDEQPVIKEAKAKLEQARLNLSYTKVTAKISGYITRRQVEALWRTL